jgi:ubiquinone/menaquinone biosynthesis C-methylase UbiE
MASPEYIRSFHHGQTERHLSPEHARSQLQSFIEVDPASKYENEDYCLKYFEHAYGSYFVDATTEPDVFVGAGDSEALYQITVSSAWKELALQGVSEKTCNVLFVGCGVGRSCYELAGIFPKSQFVGVDKSLQILTLAHRAVVDAEAINCNLECSGYKPRALHLSPRKNVYLVHADATALPVDFSEYGSDMGFDLVILDMLIDRMLAPNDVLDAINEARRVSKTDGAILVSTAFNWPTKEMWDAYGSSRHSLLAQLIAKGYNIRDIVDNVPYFERYDTFGTGLFLPVCFFKIQLGEG